MAKAAGPAPLARAVAFGGGLGLLLAGAALVAWAFLRVRGVDCAPLEPAECALEREIARTVAQRQLMVGAALLLGAVAAFLGLRAASRSGGDGGLEDEDAA